MQKMFSENGYCYFAVDTLEGNDFIGFIGLCQQEYDVEFSPFVDIGWRLDKKYWGKGLATEGAKKCLEYAFNKLDIKSIKSTAPLVNKDSINVMEKIGMKKLLDFEHPKLLENERLVNCVCYEIKQDKSQIAINVFDKLADLYQEKYMDVSAYHKSFDFFCDSIQKEKAEILELACGPGNITKYILQKRPDFNILGTDLAPKMIALAKENNPSANFQILDSRKINTLTKKFNGIMCGFCFPYLDKSEVDDLISDASQSLHANGIIYLSTMEEDYSKSGLTKGSTGDEIFIHYYLEKDLTVILQKNNFEILGITRAPSPKQSTNDLIIIAQLND
jgi:2-polyprenyl-3-methyl-5-hydroxy-6-metoxy-1,4-benzoquinol methylase